MTDEKLTPEQEKAVAEAAQYVAAQLGAGVKPDKVVQEMVKSGWEEEPARQFVANIAEEVAKAPQRFAPQQESAVGGWVVWIGIIVGVNVLSYIFDWPFWVY